MITDPIHILLIEDDLDDVLLLKEALAESTTQRFQITHAGRLDKGLDCIAVEAFDVILLDLNLPDSRGLDTLKTLLQHTSLMPVVVMSGLADEALALLAVQQGAQNYLVKGSLDGQMIARMLRYTIERHGLYRDLQISETRTRAIIESNIDGIIIVDGKGVVRFANVVAEALFSRSATLVGEAFGFPIILDKAQELEVLQLDDTVCLVEMRTTDIDWDGQPAYLVSLRDITQQRETEEVLHQSENRYRTLVRNLPDIILRFDRQCRFIYASENMVEISGIQAQDYVGKTHYEVDLTPEWANYWQVELENVMDTGVASDGEYLHDGENGRFYLYWRLIPEFDSEGEVTGVLGIFQDISERYQNEMLLNKQQAIARIASSLRQAVSRDEMLPIILSELLSIMEATVAALLTPDLQTGEWVVELTQGKHNYLIGTRLPSENVLTNQIFAYEKPFINNEVHDELGLPLQDKLETVQAVAALPLSIHGNELGIIWIGRIHPILPNDLELLAAVSDIAASALFRVELFEEMQQQALGLAENVRERTAALSLANAQLSAALYSRDLFLTSMSHELRTPLSVIIMRAEILQDQIHGPLNPKQNKAIEIIHQSAENQLALITDILDVIKIESGQVTLDLETLFVRDVCQSSLYMVQALAHKKQIHITFQVIPEDLRIVADSRRLKQILVNLLSNAVKFTPENGEVGLLVDNEPHHAVRFTVWDTGIGVHKEDIAKMFEPFVQIDNGLTKKYPGTGLGLALVRHLVELHGGDIQIESEVNEGTQISFMLPQQIKEDPVPSNGTQPMMTRKNGNNEKEKVKVLLAEDTQLMADGIVEYLSVFNYEVIVAQNGVEAVEKTAQFMPKLVLMDIQMPVMDGLEAIECIRNGDTQMANVPIVALTALAMPGDDERCIEAGANSYLAKPFTLSELKVAIDDLLEEYVNVEE